MGSYANTKFQNLIDGTILAAVIGISTLYGISTIFPNLFGG
jgi:hypothetical protein